MPRVLIVGSGPEEKRLRRYAGELGIADLVEVRAEVPYAEMPGVVREAPRASFSGAFRSWSWEEQFGMVLAEAMAAGWR